MYVSVFPHPRSNCTLSLWVSWDLVKGLSEAYTKGSKPIDTHFKPFKYLLKFASVPLL